MKKILLLFVIWAICSCTSTDAEIKALQEKVDSVEISRTNDRIYSSIKEVEVKGHVYLIFDGYYSGNIIHAEHCPCKNH